MPVTIRELGRQGDGIADTPDGVVYVPFTLAGEIVELEPITPAKARNGARGRVGRRRTKPGEKPAGQRSMARILEPSPDRVDPVCRHFGVCGGCQLQHFSRPGYLDWKQALVSAALSRAGIDHGLQPILAFGPGARRRAVFTARANAGRIEFGFLQRDSNQVIDIGECPVMVTEIERRLSEFRDLAALLSAGKSSVKISVLACSNGLDVAVSSDAAVNQGQQQAAIAFAGKHDFARLSLNGEILVELRRPQLDSGIASVTPQPDAFVQAVLAAEKAMAQRVCDHLAGCQSVADLFCGHGAFALRLAVNSTVLAADSEAGAIAALDRAWRETGGKLKQILTERRDLYRRPVAAAELKKFEGAVFDPPRAGAAEQATQLALSKVGRIAAVSCNPVTLARDLAILTEAGFKLLSITPVDQFIYTPHVETVALLER